MKVVIINKSDRRGGAAVVSFRLMEALRQEGVEASMLVTEKLSDSPFVHLAASDSKIKIPFLAERLKIFLRNGLNRSTLFRIDTASDGLPLWRHPAVNEADVICLNWVNQGMLSLRGLRKLAALGKPIVWTMHDMWNMTGICHHAGQCTHFMKQCGDCHLLGACKSPSDLSNAVFKAKKKAYSGRGITFVAVSNWLASIARKSPLLAPEDVIVIPNAFDFRQRRHHIAHSRPDNRHVSLLFGAARLDDPIKGLPVLIKATGILKASRPDLSQRITLTLFGDIRDRDLLNNFSIEVNYLGMIHGESNIENLYRSNDIIISASEWETLPGTLVEGQAYGCIPVAFDHGGQRDIIEDGVTGYIAPWDDDKEARAANLAAKLAQAIELSEARKAEMRQQMYDSAKHKFSYPAIAASYTILFKKLLEK